MIKFVRIFLVIFLCNTTGLFSQFNRQIADSLLHVINSNANDSLKIKALMPLAWEYVRRDMQGADTLIDLLEKLSKNTKNISGEYAANNYRGVYFDHLSDFPKALNSYEKGLKIANELNDSSKISAVLKNIGLVHERKGDFEKALDFYYRSLDIREKMNDKRGVASSLIGIGTIYRSMKNYESALANFEKSLKIYEELQDNYGMAIQFGNMSGVYYFLKDYEKALKYSLLTLKIMQELSNKGGEANTLSNLGEIYELMGKNELAIECYNKSLIIRKEIGDKRGLSISMDAIASNYLKRGMNAKAVEYFLNAYQISSEIGAKVSLLSACDGLAEAYSYLGKYSEAYKYSLLYAQINDSLINEENAKTIASLNAKYENEKKEEEIKLLENEKLLNDALIKTKSEETKRYSFQRNAIIGGLVLLLLLAFMIFNGYKNKLRINKQLQQQKGEIEIKNSQLEEIGKIINLQKDEISEKNTEIIDSITYAKRLQEAILPPQNMLRSFFNSSFILYKPKDIVAGDFYFFEAIKNETQKDITDLFIAVADCTGHGVPGAMVSVVCSNALNRAVKEFGLSDTGKILDKVTDLVIETFDKSETEVKDGMDISLLKIQIALEDSYKPVKIEWSGANNPLWFIENGELKEIKADKQPIGKYAERKQFTTHSISCKDSKSFYLFTDGYADQFGGEKGKKLKASKFKEIILAIKNDPAEDQKFFIEEAFNNWKEGYEQVDDVCIIGIRS